jgi:hypothetical protein
MQLGLDLNDDLKCLTDSPPKSMTPWLEWPEKCALKGRGLANVPAIMTQLVALL